VGAGLAVHSFLNLPTVDLGVRTDHPLTFYLVVPESRSKEPEKIVAYESKPKVLRKSDATQFLLS
jgi:putative ABC transport system permease protein